jgi:hypothetical protein
MRQIILNPREKQIKPKPNIPLSQKKELTTANPLLVFNGCALIIR